VVFKKSIAYEETCNCDSTAEQSLETFVKKFFSVISISALLQIILESEMGGAKNQPVLLSRNFEKGGAAAAAGTEPRPASQLSDRSAKGVDVRHFLWFNLTV
jgi:hypothetical protein